eukprot:765218-Hanusia_phi.AAC.1
MMMSGSLRSGWQVKIPNSNAFGNVIFVASRLHMICLLCHHCGYGSVCLDRVTGVSLSSNGAGADGPGVMRPRRRMQRAPRSSAGRQDGSGLGW